MERNMKTGLFQSALAMAQEISNAADDFAHALGRAVAEEDSGTIDELLEKAKKDLVNMDYAYDQIMAMYEKADQYGG